MKRPAQIDDVPTRFDQADAGAPARMGSEYCDARTYLARRAHPSHARASDSTSHGSNESDFIGDVVARGAHRG